MRLEVDTVRFKLYCSAIQYIDNLFNVCSAYIVYVQAYSTVCLYSLLSYTVYGYTVLLSYTVL